MKATGLRLSGTRRRLAAMRAARAPAAAEARAMWDQIQDALRDLESGAIEAAHFEVLIRQHLARSAELTLRGEISVLDAEQVNRLAATAQSRATGRDRTAPSN